MEKLLKLSPFTKIKENSHSLDNSFIGLLTMLIVVAAVLVVTFFKNGEFSR